MKKKIPVVDICHLTGGKRTNNDFLIDRFQHYLRHHYDTLHHPHRHSFYHMVLFTKGRGYHTIDFEKFDVMPFQAYFMSPGQVHSWHFERGVQGYVINFSDTFFRSFLLSVDYLERFNFLTGTAAEGCFLLPKDIREKVVEAMEEMLQMARQPYDKNDEDWFKTALLKLFFTINNAKDSFRKKTAHPVKQQLFNDFKRLIEKHYAEMKLPKGYAALLHITANHLNVLCNELAGISAGRFIRNRLLLESKRLLVNANLSIAEVAGELSFEDNSYFNRFFKKYEGITPNEFRKQFITT